MKPDLKKTTILVNRNGMGIANQALRQLLIGKYFSLMLESNQLPAVICFYAEGVHLAVTGSPVLEQLKELQNRGVHLILCSTCVDFYNINDQVEVGIVGGMTDILEAQIRADKVVTL
jgi:predicted peroxiredoxin